MGKIEAGDMSNLQSAIDELAEGCVLALCDHLSAGATPITSNIGQTAETPAWTTWCCCADATIAWFMKDRWLCRR